MLLNVHLCIRRLNDLRSGAFLVLSARLFQDLVARNLKEWWPKLVVLTRDRVSLLAPLKDKPAKRRVSNSVTCTWDLRSR